MKKYIIGGIAVLLIGAGGIVGYYTLNDISPEQETTITLATFNLEKLSENDPFQIQNAVKIIRQFDVVAIQEVMNSGNGVSGPNAVKMIEDSLGSEWESIISDEANGTASAASSGALHTFEYYAYLWNTDRIALIPGSDFLWDEEENPDPDLTDQERQFDREPYIASFRSIDGNLDFTIISIHAAAPSKSYRKDEIKRLQRVFDTIQASDPDQNDIYLCGDFNTPVNKTEWDNLKSIMSMDHILTEGNKTTIRKQTGELSSNQYDTFWFQKSASEEDIVLNSGQVLDAWNIDMTLDPDKTPPETVIDADNIRRWHYSRVVSDHLPIIIVLRTNSDTDHFH